MSNQPLPIHNVDFTLEPGNSVTRSQVGSFLFAYQITDLVTGLPSTLNVRAKGTLDSFDLPQGLKVRLADPVSFKELEYTNKTPNKISATMYSGMGDVDGGPVTIEGDVSFGSAGPLPVNVQNASLVVDQAAAWNVVIDPGQLPMPVDIGAVGTLGVSLDAVSAGPLVIDWTGYPGATGTQDVNIASQAAPVDVNITSGGVTVTGPISADLDPAFTGAWSDTTPALKVVSEPVAETRFQYITFDYGFEADNNPVSNAATLAPADEYDKITWLVLRSDDEDADLGLSYLDSALLLPLRVGASYEMEGPFSASGAMANPVLTPPAGTGWKVRGIFKKRAS